jgi:hypothetical protein
MLKSWTKRKSGRGPESWSNRWPTRAVGHLTVERIIWLPLDPPGVLSKQRTQGLVGVSYNLERLFALKNLAVVA